SFARANPPLSQERWVRASKARLTHPTELGTTFIAWELESSALNESPENGLNCPKKSRHHHNDDAAKHCSQKCAKEPRSDVTVSHRSQPPRSSLHLTGERRAVRPTWVPAPTSALRLDARLKRLSPLLPPIEPYERLAAGLRAQLVD